MSSRNPYAYESALPAARADVSERARFLQKTYTWLLIGILGFCGVLGAWPHVPALQSLSFALFGNPIVAILVLLGLAFGVHAIAEKHPINIVGYAAYVLVFGLALAPLVAFANATAPNVVSQASLITAVTFLGLTVYVFSSGRDFSFLGGMLRMGLFALIAVALASWIFGFDVGIWYSVVAALLFCGYILYDTGQILHRYPTTAHITAAIVLFTDVVILFKHILLLLLRNRD
ncbi:MAG: Bax inhibitor-1 family protein [Planctomycetes bacterium]|nr:Bax inhibitor-1 family protein [Planctomycetota bacterium]